MVFTEFLEMVENQFSLEVADQIIEDSDLASGGAYTSIGTYDHEEMVRLVGQLSRRTGIPEVELLRAFGEYLFPRLAAGHAQFIVGKKDAFALLRSLEGHIHVEVQKLYPEAELPRFEIGGAGADGLRMRYSSARPFAEFAHGLLMGVIDHFDEAIEVEREDGGSDGHAASFLLTRKE